MGVGRGCISIFRIFSFGACAGGCVVARIPYGRSSTLVHADTRFPEFLVIVPPALVLTNVRSPIFLAGTLFVLVLADARSLAFIALAPYALALSYVRSLALLASALATPVRAGVRSPTFLAFPPSAHDRQL